MKTVRAGYCPVLDLRAPLIERLKVPLETSGFLYVQYDGLAGHGDHNAFCFEIAFKGTRVTVGASDLGGTIAFMERRWTGP